MQAFSVLLTFSEFTRESEWTSTLRNVESRLLPLGVNQLMNHRPRILNKERSIGENGAIFSAFVRRVLSKTYEADRKCAAEFKKAMKIVFGEFLPKWNYMAVPEGL
jgi:hypothetical protein